MTTLSNNIDFKCEQNEHMSINMEIDDNGLEFYVRCRTGTEPFFMKYLNIKERILLRQQLKGMIELIDLYNEHVVLQGNEE